MVFRGEIGFVDETIDYPHPPVVYGPVACGLGLAVYTRFMDGLGL